MSGIVQNNTVRSSGTIAVAAGGLNWDSAVITGSTLSAEAGKGYFINTTSNTCTITLPSAAEAGDQIVFMDYARTWGTNKIIIDSNGLNYQGDDDSSAVEYATSGETLDIVYSGATKGWIPQNDDTVADAPVQPPTQKGIFGFGNAAGSNTGVTNLISSSGVVASDTAAVGTARSNIGASTFGKDRAIFAFGDSNVSNIVANTGVVQSNVSQVGSARNSVVGCPFGGDKAIFSYTSGADVTNLVSNSGVIASDTAGVGTQRDAMGGAGFGASNSNGIWAYGQGGYNISNIISTVGIVSADITGVGTARYNLAGTMFGGDKGIFGYGYAADQFNGTNKVSNTGVVASDTTGVGTARNFLAASTYGGDKGIFGFGNGNKSMTNLVSNTGVVSADVTGVGTGRFELAGAGYSQSA